MIVKSTVKFANTTLQFEVDEREDKIAMLKAIGLASPRVNCNVCSDVGLENKYINARENKNDNGTFQFISLRCKCGAQSNLGEYASGNGYFWKEYSQFKKDEKKSEDI